MSTGWTFLSNHTHVLVCIDRDPSLTMREVAEKVGVTERAVQRIVRDLVDGGYLLRQRQGRRNVYPVCPDRPLRHALEAGTELKQLLEVLHIASPGRAVDVPPVVARRSRRPAAG